MIIIEAEGLLHNNEAICLSKSLFDVSIIVPYHPIDKSHLVLPFVVYHAANVRRYVAEL